MSVMSNQSISMIGVKEDRTNRGVGLLPGRYPTEPTKGGRRRKRSQDVNRIVMVCYYSSNPKLVGYRERMYMIWKEKGMFDVKKNDCWIRNGKKVFLRFRIE